MSLEDFTAMIDEMIERKERYFTQYDRMVINYELIERDRSCHHSDVIVEP